MTAFNDNCSSSDMTADGRISMAGLNAKNIEYVDSSFYRVVDVFLRPCILRSDLLLIPTHLFFTYCGWLSYFAENVSKVVKGEL